MSAPPPTAGASRGLRSIVNLPRQPAATGFQLAKLHPQLIGGGMGPFLQIDAFALAEPVFAPHPHAGFSAVTYILPESATGFINRDTLGQRQRIAPGALHWTAAGSGIQHEEVPELRGDAVLGLQMFIDLPSALKGMAPQALHLEAQDIPVWRDNGVDVRVVVGSCNGVTSPLQPPTPDVLLLDISLAPAARLTTALQADHEVFAWVMSGEVTVHGPAGPEVLVRHDFSGFTSGGRQLDLQAGHAGARLVLAGGRPLDQPVVAQGPFVLDSPTALQHAKLRYTAGAMGWLAPTRYGDDRRPLPPSAADVRLASLT